MKSLNKDVSRKLGCTSNDCKNILNSLFTNWNGDQTYTNKILKPFA